MIILDYVIIDFVIELLMIHYSFLAARNYPKLYTDQLPYFSFSSVLGIMINRTK